MKLWFDNGHKTGNNVAINEQRTIHQCEIREFQNEMNTKHTEGFHYNFKQKTASAKYKT